MASTYLTPTAVTRKALSVLHQKLTFVGSINRQYDSSFAQTGAKIGDTLKIRKPNQYVVRTGRVLDVQDTAEESVSLQVATQKGVDMSFTSADLTLSIDDFSERFIEPAMSVLAANVEYDAMAMYKDVWNEISDVGGTPTFKSLMQGHGKLLDNLAPQGDNIMCCLNVEDNINLVDALKGLFQDSSQIAAQYRDGFLGRAAGMNFAVNTLLPIHTTGTDDGTGDYLTDDTTAQTGATLTVDTGAGTFKQGDVITIDDVFRVHPETKASTGELQRFVVTADVAANATAIPISPAIVASGAKQNVTNGAANNKAIRKRESDGSTAIGASADYKISMLHHRDAFTFATADLEMPGGMDFAAREVMDGLSMRILRQYDINNDAIPARIDIMYGYKAIRPEWACRLGFN